MKKCSLCILIFINVFLFSQEENIKQDIEELKAAVEKLLQKDKQSQKKINTLLQRDKQHQKKIDNLQLQVKELKDDSQKEIRVQRRSKVLAREAELIINEEFGAEDEEQNVDNWAANLGFLAQITHEASNGSFILGGFFTIEYNDFDTNNSTLEPLFRDVATFNNSHINLYFDSRFYEDFRFFAELRFTFQPFTTTLDLGQVEQSGEVIIERAWAQWEFRDWLQIRAGTFFVPYGIWNLEHGDPILLSTFTPVLVRRELFPDRVTGIQIHGLLNFDDYDLLYYAWVGNGKAGQPATQDDQTHKSFGGRLELQFPRYGPLHDMAVGVSGYYGKVLGPEVNDQGLNNIVTQIFQAEGNAILLQQFALAGLSATGEPLNEYLDRAIGADFRFRFYDFFLQAEGAVNFVNPTTAAVLDLNGDGVPETQVGPADSFLEYGGYVQLAYEFDMQPFGIWGLLTPFVRLGYYENNDNIEKELGSLHIVTGGLNWKVNPHVVIKLEYSDVKFADVSARDFSLFISSLTVGF